MATISSRGARWSDRHASGVEARSRTTFHLADRPSSDSLESRSAQGVGGDPLDGAQLEASDWQEVAGGEADWERDRRTLLEISTQFLTRTQALDDAGLSKPVVWYQGGATQPLVVRVVRTTTHDVYHAGQIRYLRALQGISGKRKKWRST